MIARRKIDVVPGVGGAGRPHVFRLKGILEREWDAIHWELRQIRVAAVLRVQLRGALERVGLLAKFLADRRRPSRQRAARGVPVTIALTRHRSFTAEVERGQRVHLAGIRRAHGHAVLLLHLRIRGGRFHAAELNRRPGVPIEVGQEQRDRHRLSREFDWLAGADGTTRRRDRFAVAGYEAIARVVVGAGALEVRLDQPAAGDLPLLDGTMDVGDRRFHELELQLLRCGALPPQERHTNQGEHEQGRRDDK